MFRVSHPNFNSGAYLAKLTPMGKCIWANSEWDSVLTADMTGRLFGGWAHKWDPDGHHIWSTLPEQGCLTARGLRITAANDLQIAHDACLRAIDDSGNTLWTQHFDLPVVAGAAIDVEGVTVLTGHFTETLDLIGPWLSAGERDVWLTRLLPPG